MNKEEREVIVKANDFHVPFQDDKAVDVFLKFITFLQPKILVIDEVIDFYSISRFDKNPTRKLTLQEDIDMSFKLLKRIKVCVPDTRIIMVESNHDKRLGKYLTSNAEELTTLRCLALQSLLGLAELDIEYMKDFMYRGVLFKHGDIVRKRSGQTAKAEFEKENVSGASGHTHRLGEYRIRQRGGEYVWLESGCLCLRDGIEYIEGTADWHQGLSLWSFKKNSSQFYDTKIHIKDYTILWGKRTFK